MTSHPHKHQGFGEGSGQKGRRLRKAGGCSIYRQPRVRASASAQSCNGSEGPVELSRWAPRKDRFGLSWQIVPRVLIEAITDPDTAAAKRAMDAMMTMKKIDIARIEAARADDARALRPA